ncbi:alpha/beta fold hydrolase [Nonomuraea sp. NN258]|uniref:alpha/beta fold hydrolase n=1 Tax=Nonomuraea antri TaxID=2730852 RepID=UPI00156A2592|nr:alpha/beta fold hydrolase [Nonomuraea antri]NRQ37880.1 alpha/beta fold hydrolase [Nonomuraea antri]
MPFLRVPGAELYHEVSGRGPVLLLLPGGGGDAAVFDVLAGPLAERFTLVTLDPRGYSRSRLDPPEPVGQRVEVQSDDARRLLDAVSPGRPAYVFGGSSGAIVGLDLLARYPSRVRRLVAHEPPCFAVLPDADAQLAFVEEVYRLFRTRGLGAASERFLAGIGGTMKALLDPASLPPRAAAMMSRLMANAPLMMEHELRSFTAYRPDLAALAAAGDRLVLAAGRGSRGQLPYRPAAVLAERLGVGLVEFPGAHSGFTDEPAAFADRLIDVLGGGAGVG